MPDSERCAVCQLAVEAHMEATCGDCGNLYHLNSRADLPGDDCGQVWINEEHLGLQFACNTCLNPPEEPAPSGLDDILDLGEAALASGLSEQSLVRSAELGHVKHRKTSSGTLLFVRADVLAFAASHQSAAGNIDTERTSIDNLPVPSTCVECKEQIGPQSALTCADCGGIFHFPDSRINEVGRACGVHVIGFRSLLGRDVVPMCLRCDMAFRLRFGIPS